MATPEQIIAAHAAQMRRLHDLAVAGADRAWLATAGVDDASAEAWLGAVLPIVEGAQQTASTQTVSYLSTLIAEMTGDTFDPPPIDPTTVTGAAARNGATPAEVYRRPIIQARSLIAAGWPGAEALRRAGTRAQVMVSTDIQLAAIHTSRAVLRG